MRAFLLTLFGSALLFLSVTAPGMYVSPDENANAFFATQWAEQGMLSMGEPLNEALHGLLHPRSILAHGTRLVPGSFLGLPVLAGSFTALIGPVALVIFTPILAVLAILAFRSILLRVSSNAFLADAGAFLLMFHPAFWYYASRPMMHNVPFLAFLIFGVWFAVCLPARRWVSFLLSGTFIGLALATRTSEVLWILPMIIAASLTFRSYLTWRDVLIWIAGLVVALVPFAVLNYQLYGSIFETGYTISSDTPVGTYAATNPTEIKASPTSFLFPFDIHLLRAGKRVLDYGILLYPWTAVLPLIGWLLLAKTSAMTTDSGKKNRFRVFLALSVLVSAYLAILYGSWIIKDNPDPTAITIGNSYVRYWLPIFAIGAVFAAIAVSWVKDRWGKRRWFTPTMIGAAILYVAVGSMVVWGGEDGLLATREHLLAFREKQLYVVEHTESDAIVIVDRADKFIFPDRRVVTPLRSDKTYDALDEMAALAPLYYFGIPFPDQDIAFLQETRLDPIGLTIEQIGISGDESLYRISVK